MREFVVSSWNSVMDARYNPLRNIPDLQVRHMVMQVLAFMWSSVFAIQIANSIWAFSISAIAHVALVAAVVVTVATFKTAEKRPWAFGSYHSYGRSRGYTIFYDKQGNPKKHYYDEKDPGGEHE